MNSDRFGFHHFAKQSPNDIAIVEANGFEWSRGRLMAVANGVALAFRSAGLISGDSVAIVSRNRAEYIAVYLAGVQAGLYVVPINWHLSASEISFVVENSGAKAIIADGRLSSTLLDDLAAIAKARGAIAVAFGYAAGWRSLDAFVSQSISRAMPMPGNGRVMAYTSATTGRPKGVKLPLGNATAALERIVRWHQSLGIELSNDNVHLCASMLYHSAPLEGAVTALHMGHRLVLLDHWRPELLLQAIERYRVTTSFMVPAMFIRLIKLHEKIRMTYSTDSLRFIVHAGAPCPISVKRAMLDWWGPIIWESYGAAEGQGAIASPQDWIKYPGTVGRPFPGSRFEILTEAGERAPPGHPGTIYFRPHTSDRFEYKGDPEATRASYRNDMITVGDIGYMNEEGYIFVSDRRTDIIISSGMNIYPAEIEQILIQHPAVLDCAVFGASHELLGEVPWAAIQLRPDESARSELTMDILAYLQGQLSQIKLPKRVLYVDEIPRDPSGKLFRRLLRQSTST